MNNALSGFAYIYILRWGARATGTNIDWCPTPGIKQKATSGMSLFSPHGVQESGKLGDKKESNSLV
jgi:hypothetical protein